MGCHRRDYKAEHKMASIVLLYDLGATQGNDAKARGISGTQWTTWRLGIEAFGSAGAKRRQKVGGSDHERK